LTSRPQDAGVIRPDSLQVLCRFFGKDWPPSFRTATIFPERIALFKPGLIGSHRARKLASLALGCALGGAVLLAGYGRRRQPRCRFGRDQVVAVSRGKRIDAVALVADERGPVAFWSDIDGLFARRVEPAGRPEGPVIRLAPRCSGGIDALDGDDGIILACLRRPAWKREARVADDAGVAEETNGANDAGDTDGENDADRPAGVFVYRLTRDLVLDRAVRFTGAGSMSRGVSLASRGGRVRVAWHDGSPDRQRVWLAEISEAEISEKETPPPRVISDPLHLAGAPSIAPGDREWVVWVETWIEDDRTRGRVTLHDGKGAPRGLAPVSYPRADPRVVEVGGRPLLAYRKRRGSVGRAGLYFAWMGGDGRPVGKPARVARADAAAWPAVSPCQGGIVVAAPRTYGASRFIGVNLIDLSFGKKGGEQHFYDVSREMSLAASICVDESSLLLIAEQGASSQKDTKLRSITFSCD
jgi:hypothetical protein